MTFLRLSCLFCLMAGCIDLERAKPDAADVAQPDVGVDVADASDLDAADVPYPDIPDVADTPDAADTLEIQETADGDVGCDCPPNVDPCMEGICVGGECQQVAANNNGPCDEGTCPPSVCFNGACVPAPILEGVQSCVTTADCPTSACGTVNCNQESCTCIADTDGDAIGPNCCIGGGCEEVSSTASGCATYACDVATNTCELPENFEPTACQCSTAKDCGGSLDVCPAWKCEAEGCVASEPECTACPDGDDATCTEVGLAAGPCHVGICTNGKCVATPDPTCKPCSSVAQCDSEEPCVGATCIEGACDFAPIPGCMPCDDVSDCGTAPGCGSSSYGCGNGACILNTGDCGLPCTNPELGACEDDNICTIDTCAGSGLCKNTPTPTCADQLCNSMDAIAVNSAVLAPLNSVIKVQARPTLGYLSSQAVPCSGGTNPYSGQGPISLGTSTQYLATSALGLQAEPTEWDCLSDCNDIVCSPAETEFEYWMWGQVKEAPGLGKHLEVSGWCLAMTAENLAGNYTFDIKLQNSTISDGAASFMVQPGGGMSFVVVPDSVLVTNVALNSEKGELQVTVAVLTEQPPLEFTITLMGKGNDLAGETSTADGSQKIDVTMTRLPTTGL